MGLRLDLSDRNYDGGEGRGGSGGVRRLGWGRGRRPGEWGVKRFLLVRLSPTLFVSLVGDPLGVELLIDPGHL